MHRSTYNWPAFTVLWLVLVGLVGCGEPGRPSPTGSKAFGESCTKTEECASSLCVRLGEGEGEGEGSGICSSSCSDDSTCPKSDNWGCVTAEQQAFSVCACVQLASTEVCEDNLDNDCNGKVDDCRLCDGRLVASDDVEHCGGCGNACHAGQACRNGSCSCLAELPTDCGDRCTDTQHDSLNCGECGTACGLGQSCADGACACPGYIPDHCAGQGCFNFASDASNCGQCGTACEAGLLCTGGVCTCPSDGPPYFCPNVGCVDQQSNPKYCGACDNVCGEGQSCVAGECVCPSDQTLCDGVCVNTSLDEANCGECGNTCGAALACIVGKCDCSTGGYEVCGESCVAVASDPLNCGTCGTECASGELCSQSDCVCNSQVYCGDVCMPENDGANCGACGNACPVGQSCSGIDCICDGFGLEQCANSCVDFDSDEQNCGDCGVACRNGETCSQFGCECPYPSTYCQSAGTCVPLDSDEQNCGECGKQCKATETCTNGSCGCPLAGQLFCAAQGACIDTLQDEMHCGSCTTQCQPSEVCSNGGCGCTGFSEDFCATANTCVDLYTSGDHCGQCDQACPVGTHCYFGGCTCDTGGESLCGDTCYDLASDADNCGSCGNDCGGAFVCNGGTCKCPNPAVGTSVRVTNDAGNDWGPVLAWNGTNVGVLYKRTASSTTNVRFALLKPDGSVVSDTAVTTYGATQRSPGAAGITWNGSEFALVWSLYDIGAGYQVMFQRLDATGVSKGAAVSVSGALGEGIVGPGIAWSSGYAGYGVAYNRNGAAAGLAFRRIGATGAVLEAENVLSGGAFSDAATQIVVAPDGKWGVNANGLFAVYNADGSRTSAALNFSATNALLYDGANWLNTFVQGSSFTLANRGTTSASLVVLSPPESGQYYDNASALAGGTVALLLDYQSPTGVDHQLRLQRFSLPASASSAALTPVHDVVEVLPTSNLSRAFDETRNFSLITTGASALLAVWADTRWGANKELHASPIDLKSCP